MHTHCMTRVYQQISARPWAVVRAEAEQAGQHRASYYMELTDVPAIVSCSNPRTVADWDYHGGLRDEADINGIYFVGGETNLRDYFDEAEQQCIYRDEVISSIEIYLDIIWNGSGKAPEISDVFIHGTTDSVFSVLHASEVKELAKLIRDEVMA